MVRFALNASTFGVVADWDIGLWEFNCRIKLFHPNHDASVRNHTFFGALGISSGPAWYVDEESALKVASICADHALEISKMLVEQMDGAV